MCILIYKKKVKETNKIIKNSNYSNINNHNNCKNKIHYYYD